MDIKQIKLQPELEKAVMDLGFSEFTEIQEKVIPLIQQGHDVIGLSHTGSGKTAAFGFPSLEKVTKGQGIQLLVLVPTRELCNQVAKEIFKFAKYKPLRIVETYGGVSISPQIQMLQHADVVVSTPGRMLDHMERRTINLSKVKVLVLDEADKMFEMGFIDDVKRIISQTPKDRQNLLFSATMGHGVSEIVHQYMRNPVKIKLQSYVDKSKLTQHYYDINARDKFSLLVHVLKENKEGLAIIFCATRRMVDVLNSNLSKHGVKAEALHGGLSQNMRKHVMDAFHAHKLDALIATDVAARGLDIKNVSNVINYDIPKTSEDYVHRIGRTARAGCEGKVISLLAAQDHDNFRNVLQDRSLLMQRMEIPAFERIPFEMSSGRPQHRGGFRGGGGGRGGGSRGGFGNRGSSGGFRGRGR
ncbi:DEAD/DEAH box helicase [Candidatus Woesearchaeota archaeon]|nr:DEAD/DEAH box helicase [Candidatus Woesearchaeota archaeon]